MNTSLSLYIPNNAKKYDYIFAGAGVSACLVLLELHRKNLLLQKSILLIDPTVHNTNDKTFCFWADEQETILEILSPLISHSWSHIQISETKIENISPLTYNHIESISLYHEIEKLEKIYSWDRLFYPVEEVHRDHTGPYICTNGLQYYADIIFDSRTPTYLSKGHFQTHIFQSFIGWTIQLDKSLFDVDTFRMMDFNIEQNDCTQFVYVLPFSSTQALVELTRFGSDLIQKQSAEQYLHHYITEQFGEYSIIDSEHGCIPMSNVKIDNEIKKDIILLGARNYLTKPSTGYTFKSMFYHANNIVDNIFSSQDINSLNKEYTHMSTGRFAFYDSLLLHILYTKPHQGKPIFQALFRGVNTKHILRFLDEKTSLKEDIVLFTVLPWTPFLLALVQKIIGLTWFRPLLLTCLTILLYALGYNTISQQIIGYGILALGLFVVGIPHGAVDHILEMGHWDRKKTPSFIISYLLLSLFFGCIWYVNAPLALFLFIGYSCWHFGEADGKQWGFSSIISFLWGITVLLYILTSHLSETNIIINSIAQITFSLKVPEWIFLPFFLFSIFKKQYSLSITILWLLISSHIPLLLAFGIYFIGQHSITSWGHIKNHIQQSNVTIWKKALPFHAGAWLMLLIFFIIRPQISLSGTETLAHWGTFFIFISCISLPHSLAMHRLYRKKSTI